MESKWRYRSSRDICNRFRRTSGCWRGAAYCLLSYRPLSRLASDIAVRCGVRCRLAREQQGAGNAEKRGLSRFSCSILLRDSRIGRLPGRVGEMVSPILTDSPTMSSGKKKWSVPVYPRNVVCPLFSHGLPDQRRLPSSVLRARRSPARDQRKAKASSSWPLHPVPPYRP